MLSGEIALKTNHYYHYHIILIPGICGENAYYHGRKEYNPKVQ